VDWQGACGRVCVNAKLIAHRTMTEEFQIHIPPSFIALFVPKGKIKPTLGQRDMAARYELCEDLANLLTEKAANMQFTLGISEDLVLQQCALGLLAEPTVLSPAEAHWVVCRLAELLNWPMDWSVDWPTQPLPAPSNPREALP
jgi:hypothetical protein